MDASRLPLSWAILIAMENVGFEAALNTRVDEMLDACTKCGACFTACPIAEPAGLGGANPEALISGVLDILRLGKGPEESEKWAKACMASGASIAWSSSGPSVS